MPAKFSPEAKENCEVIRFSVPMNISDRTTAETKAAKCHHRRRTARNPAMAIRMGRVR